MDDDLHLDAPHWEDYESPLWKPVERHGWTWVPTGSLPELHWLFDADGELVGEVCQRFGRVIRWAPFTWAEEAYRSEEDIGEFGFESEAKRERHFARIGESLSDWVRQKREAGVDIPLLRDTRACYFKAGNGHDPMTLEERKFRIRRRCPDSAPSVEVGGWRAGRDRNWCCEGHWLRDPSGQLMGVVQVRLGVVRAVAAQAADAGEVDPARRAIRGGRIGSGGAICRGQIVIQERLRPMANAFADDERGGVAGQGGGGHPSNAEPRPRLAAGDHGHLGSAGAAGVLGIPARAGPAGCVQGHPNERPVNGGPGKVGEARCDVNGCIGAFEAIDPSIRRKRILVAA